MNPRKQARRSHPVVIQDLQYQIEDFLAEVGESRNVFPKRPVIVPQQGFRVRARIEYENGRQIRKDASVDYFNQAGCRVVIYFEPVDEDSQDFEPIDLGVDVSRMISDDRD